jgi:hypothetical protein
MPSFPNTVSIRRKIIFGSRFLFVLYLINLIDGKCLCPGRDKWPVTSKYESQRFCGKELNLWHSSDCDPNMKYSCTRDQVIPKEGYHCKFASRNHCAPVIPEGCDDSDTRSLYDVCMYGRACMREQFAERAMNLTYGKNPQKSKVYP